MKRTQITDLLTTIKATFVSFFSIVMFVALAVAIFLGIDWSGKALAAGAENAFTTGNFHDIEILFPYGLTDSDLEALKGVEGVSQVGAGQVAFTTVAYDDATYAVRVGPVSNSIDKLVVVEGELPTQNDQIAIEALWAKRHEVTLGQKLTVAGSENEQKQLLSKEFTVTALVESPAYLSNSANTWGASTSAAGAINLLAWVPSSCFNPDTYKGSTYVTVCSDALRKNQTLDEAYTKEADELKARIKQLGEGLAVARHDQLVADAQKELDDAKAKLDDANKKIDDGEKEIADGETKIADGEQQKKDGEAQIATAEAQIADGESQISSGWAQLNEKEAEFATKKAEYEKQRAEGEQKLAESKKKLDEGQSAYDAAKAELDNYLAQYEAAIKAINEQEAALDPTSPTYEQELAALEAQRAKLDEDKAEHYDPAAAELAEQKKELDSAIAEYESAVATFNTQITKAQQQVESAQAELDEGRAKLQSAEATLAQKKTELASGKAQFQEKLKELEDAKTQLAQAKKDLENAKKEVADKTNTYKDAESSVQKLRDDTCGWTVLSRAENGGVASLSSFVDIAGRLRTSMASLFVVVGLLVCYSAVSRLVREQVRQIGTKKALGMRALEVTLSYLLYAAAAVLLGMVFGVLGAVLVVERIIVPVLGASFYMSIPSWWSPSGAAIFGVIELVLIVAATWLACHSVLSHHAVELLNGGEAPNMKERFFERWGVWQRLPLFTQTTINNLLNDKRRVVGTLVGVAGCTALVVCAVTLNDNVVAGIGKQYVDVYHYDTVVRVNTNEADAMEQAKAAVGELGCEMSCPVATRMAALNLPDGTTTHVTITVPEDMEDFAGRTVTLTSTVGDTAGKAITPDDSGVWVSNAYAEHYGVKPGDTLKITLGDGTVCEMKIAGFFRYYLVGHKIIMTPALYEQVFGDAPTMAKLYVRSGELDVDKIEEELEKESFISDVADDRSDQETLFNSFRKVSRVVVLVYLALSLAMAVVVLLNLNVMFVEEKRRDLITLMVCGYKVSDARGYIWHDNVVLTILGIILGVAAGIIAGWAAVTSMEIANVSLVKGVVLRACLAGAGTSFVLSMLMTIISMRRIPRMQLSDINRM